MLQVDLAIPDFTSLAKRFEEHGESYFLFINDPERIAPSNNFAEQDIRTLVMDRMVTQGVRSEGATNGTHVFGRHWRRVVVAA